MPEEGLISENVTVSLEIEGEYDEVMSRLNTHDRDSTPVEPLLADLTAVLNTVVRTGGGTRSVIAENLPTDMAVRYDAEDVVNVLTVLQEYDIVALEGNTWKPGPGLNSEGLQESVAASRARRSGSESDHVS